MVVRLALVLLLAIACKDREPSQPAPPTPPVADPWAAPRPPRPEPTASDPFAQPMLWSATKDGKVMYLFGTLHVGVDVTRRLPRWIWNLFDVAKVLVQEVDLHAYAISKWGNSVLQDNSLREALGEAHWARMVAVLPPASVAFLDKVTPLGAFMQVSGVGVRVKDPEAIPMDADFLVRAKEQSKQLVFLESIDEHGELLHSLYGLVELQTLIDNIDKLRSLNRRYYDLYVAGEREPFYELSLAAFRLSAPDDAAFAKHLDRLLFARNRAWIDKIEDAHAANPSGAVFVTVGALHLLGPNRIQALLEKRGFSIALATSR